MIRIPNGSPMDRSGTEYVVHQNRCCSAQGGECSLLYTGSLVDLEISKVNEITQT